MQIILKLLKNQLIIAKEVMQMLNKPVNEMTDEEFRDFLKYMKNGKKMKTQIIKNYTELTKMKKSQKK